MSKMRKIAVLAGSKSDGKKIHKGLKLFRKAVKEQRADVVCVDYASAHRNPEEHRKLISEYVNMGVDIIVVCAGKLAAIIGNTDAILRNELGNNTTRVIGVPLKGKNEEESLAALFSVTQVPNHKIIFEREFFDDPTTAFKYALDGNIEILKLERQKPAEYFSLDEAYRNICNENIPALARYDDFIMEMEAEGLFHEYTGKVRETFSCDDYPDFLYVFQTDRISIFDIVLNKLVPKKGAVLTAMTVSFLKTTLADMPNHLVAYGSGIDVYLPKALRGRKDLHEQMLVVKKAAPLSIEAICRGFLTGSGLKDYRKSNGIVCGIQLSKGLIDGSELPETIFTASTKAEIGEHDENIPFKEVCRRIGKKKAHEVRKKTLEAYGRVRDEMRKLGIIIADTKLEFGIDKDGSLIIIDELFTPDSSRYWPVRGWRRALANGKTPPSYDKQPVRNAGEKAGIKNRNPNWVPSDKLVSKTTANYLKIAEIKFGKSLEQFQAEDMKIAA